MTTLLECLTDVKARIADTTGKFWSDTNLKRWINQGLKDVARKSETLEHIDDISVTGGDGTTSYSLATDLFRVHRVTYVITAGSNEWPLEAREMRELDTIWGRNHSYQGYAPSFYAIWGIMGIDAKIYPFPLASQSGTLKIWGYRLPATVSDDAHVLEIPAGWDNLISLYAEYCALRMDSDPRWQDAKAMYVDELNDLIGLSRSHHDQAQWVTEPAMSHLSPFNGLGW